MIRLSFIIFTLSVVFYCSADGGDLSNELDKNGVDSIFIINGNEVEIETYPFTVAINYQNQLRCGGSILNNNWVLTAAHCVCDDTGVELNPKDLEVISGDKDMSKGKATRISKIVREPSFRYGSFSNDIALIQLSAPLVFDSYTQPALLPQRYQDVNVGTEVTVVGWGYSNSNDHNEDILHSATMKVVDQNSCNTLYSAIGLSIKQSEICAGDDAKHCTGDSGGPLVMATSKGFVQVGVVSFSHKSSSDNKYPGVFSKVSYYMQFIQSVTGSLL